MVIKKGLFSCSKLPQKEQNQCIDSQETDMFSELKSTGHLHNHTTNYTGPRLTSFMCYHKRRRRRMENEKRRSYRMSAPAGEEGCFIGAQWSSFQSSCILYALFTFSQRLAYCQHLSGLTRVSVIKLPK